MTQSIASLSLLVRDYNEVLNFFTDALRFRLVEDTPLGGGKRWVRIAPPGSSGTALLLAKAATPGICCRGAEGRIKSRRFFDQAP